MKNRLLIISVGCTLLALIVTGPRLSGEVRTEVSARDDRGSGNWLERSMGLQLWSLRVQMKSDLESALRLVPGYGLTQVEIAGTGDVSPAIFREMLTQNGLVPIGAHYGFDRLQGDLPGVIAEARTLGVEYVICSSLPTAVKEWNVPAMERFATDFNTCGWKLHEAGLHLVFHTHGKEFSPGKQGTSETLFDLLVRKTDPEFVCFEMDVFWVMHAGQSPIELLRRYSGRWRLLHLKDMRIGAVTGLFTGRAAPTDRVSIGSGQIDWQRLLLAARAAGVKFYFIEDETTDPLTNIPLSLYYLRHLKL